MAADGTVNSLLPSMSHASTIFCSPPIPTQSINPHTSISNPHISILNAFTCIFLSFLATPIISGFRVGDDGVFQWLIRISIGFCRIPPSRSNISSSWPLFSLQPSLLVRFFSLDTALFCCIRIEFSDRYISCIMCTCFWTYGVPHILLPSFLPVPLVFRSFIRFIDAGFVALSLVKSKACLRERLYAFQSTLISCFGRGGIVNCRLRSCLE